MSDLTNNNTALIAWGIRDGLQVFFTEGNINIDTPEIKNSLTDCRRVTKFINYNLIFYSYTTTSNFKVFTLYQSLYDKAGRSGAFFALSLYISHKSFATGKIIFESLSELSNIFNEFHFDNINKTIVPNRDLKSTKYLDILNNLIPQLANADSIAFDISKSNKFAHYHYKSKEELISLLNNPINIETRFTYKTVFFISQEIEKNIRLGDGVEVVRNFQEIKNKHINFSVFDEEQNMLETPLILQIIRNNSCVKELKLNVQQIITIEEGDEFILIISKQGFQKLVQTFRYDELEKSNKIVLREKKTILKLAINVDDNCGFNADKIHLNIYKGNPMDPQNKLNTIVADHRNGKFEYISPEIFEAGEDIIVEINYKKDKVLQNKQQELINKLQRILEEDKLNKLSETQEEDSLITTDNKIQKIVDWIQNN